MNSKRGSKALLWLALVTILSLAILYGVPISAHEADTTQYTTAINQYVAFGDRHDYGPRHHHHHDPGNCHPPSDPEVPPDPGLD